MQPSVQVCLLLFDVCQVMQVRVKRIRIAKRCALIKKYQSQSRGKNANVNSRRRRILHTLRGTKFNLPTSKESGSFPEIYFRASQVFGIFGYLQGELINPRRHPSCLPFIHNFHTRTHKFGRINPPFVFVFRRARVD